MIKISLLYHIKLILLVKREMYVNKKKKMCHPNLNIYEKKII